MNSDLKLMFEETEALIGTRVSVHTNRNKHVWSLKTADSKAKLLAYSRDIVVLEDVTWTQPSLSAARKTFHTNEGSARSGDRSVQAFARGTLLGSDKDVIPLGLEKTKVAYRPTYRTPEWVGGFRIDDPDDSDYQSGIAWSEYALLEYVEPYKTTRKRRPGSRPTRVYAVGKIELIEALEMKRFVEAIVKK